MWSWSPRSLGPLVGVITSGARASLAPVRISREFMDYIKDEMLAIVDDFVEGRRFLGVFKSSVKKDLAIDSSALPTIFDPEKSHSFSAPLMQSYVEIIGEIPPEGGLYISFAIPRPGSNVYVVEKGVELAKVLNLPQGLTIGYHKFSELQIDMDPRTLDFHVAVLGATGSGKSRLVKAIVEEVVRKKPEYSLVVFDHTGVDYADNSRWGNINVEIIDASQIVLEPDVIAEILVKYTGLTSYYEDHMYGIVLEYIKSIIDRIEKQQNVSSDKTKQVQTPYIRGRGHDMSIEEIMTKYREYSAKGLFTWSFNDFITIAEVYLAKMGAKDSTIEKVKMKLYTRIGRRFFEENLSKRRILVDNIVEKMLSNRGSVLIVDLSSEFEYSAKNSIVYQIIKRIWDYIAEGRRRANAVAVIDEAHNYCCAHGCEPARDIIARTAREGRKWGFGLILASQRIIDLAPDIRGNINTVFFSRLQTAGDYSELRNWIEGVDYMQYTLPLLAPREFFFTGLGNPLRRPILVRVRDVA
ncbi:MAG: ATP-binding protein [Ignisphaera sp.]|nr:ATP-binding protein [Ignisphaera sp.]